MITSALPLRQVFASQALELAPGYYRVGWRSPGKAGSASPTIAVRLTCQENGGDYLVRQPSGGDHLSAILEIRPDCPRQWLDLAVDPGVGPVAVDDVTVERQS